MIRADSTRAIARRSNCPSSGGCKSSTLNPIWFSSYSSASNESSSSSVILLSSRARLLVATTEHVARFQRKCGVNSSKRHKQLRRDWNETDGGYILLSLAEYLDTPCAYNGRARVCTPKYRDREECSEPDFPGANLGVVPPAEEVHRIIAEPTARERRWDSRIERPEFWSACTPPFRGGDNIVSMTSAVDCMSSASMGENGRRPKGISPRRWRAMVDSSLKRRGGSFSKSSAETARTAIFPSPR